MVRFCACALPCLSLLVAAHAATPDWQVRVTPYNQLYPALELSQARRRLGDDQAAVELGAGSGLVAVTIRAHHAGERVHLSVAADGLRAPATVDGVLAEAGREYELRPALDWDPRPLLAAAAPVPVQLQFDLQRDDAAAGTRSLAVELRPLSEALYYVRDGKDSVDLSWIFAAYVDEHDAIVDRVLASALASGIVERFDGYAAASADAVYRQVWAVWHALALRGIRYSAADPGIERGPRVYSQRVRLLEQTWNDRSANCIDGSVLIASVLQRIGLRSFLVLVPGHAFVGFYTDAGAHHGAWLETTLLGAAAPRMRQVPGFAADFGVDAARALDLPGFAAALTLGRRHYARAAARFDRAHRPDYALIDIADARAFGIRPIEGGEAGDADAGNAQPGNAAAATAN
jgi:hypothetical protein